MVGRQKLGASVLALLVCAVWIGPACSLEPGPPSSEEDASSDATTSDGAPEDGGTADGATADGASADSATADSGTPGIDVSPPSPSAKTAEGGGR